MTVRRLHFCGVGGVGMSAVAEAHLRAGHRVSGSDRLLDAGGTTPTLDRLFAMGVTLTPQDASAVTADLDEIVISTAIEADNVELAAAKPLGIPVRHRAEALARLVEGFRVIAVSGTSGKTTVTGMIGHMLTSLGLDPKVIDGGVITEWIRRDATGSVRWGGGDLCVVEVDESDKSLLAFRPELSVLTTVTADHHALPETRNLFAAFAAQTDRMLAMPEAAAAMGWPEPPVPATIARGPRGWELALPGHRPVALPVPGEHNARNALAALLVAEALGLSLADAANALGTFQGIHRRLECVGEVNGIRVFDDYAHNPEKIAASWQAAREGGDRVLAYWRPHGYGPLNTLFDALVDLFSRQMQAGDRLEWPSDKPLGAIRSAPLQRGETRHHRRTQATESPLGEGSYLRKPAYLSAIRDRLYILPVYYAGGTAARTRESADLVAALHARGVSAESLESWPELEARLVAEAQPGDVILGMGARDPELPEVARRVADGLRRRYA